MMNRILATALFGSMLFAVCAAGASVEEEHRSAPGSLTDARDRIVAGDYAGAEAIARDVFAVIEERHGGESGELVELLNVLVEALWRGGKTGESETRELAERAVAIADVTAGPQSPELSASLHELGKVLEGLGENEAAASKFERALAIDKARLGPDDPAVAIGLNNLGHVQRRMGNFEEATTLSERAIAILEAAKGPDHLAVAAPLWNLANTLAELGQSAASVPLFERAIAIQEKSLGPDHPQVGSALNDLGLTFYEMGQNKKAETHLERALRIQENALGPDHPKLASTLGNLALVSGRIGRVSREMSYYERSIKILEKSLGEDHWRVALNLGNYGLRLTNAGDLLAARGTLERALEIFENSEAAPQYTGWILLLLGAVQDRLGDYEESRRYFQRTLEIYEDQYGPDHRRVAFIVSSLGWTYEQAGDLQFALDAYQEALAIAEGLPERKERSLVDYLLNIGGIRQKMGDLEEARILFERAAVIDTQVDRGVLGNVGVTSALASLHLEAGRPDEAVRLYKLVVGSWEKMKSVQSMGDAVSDLAEAQLAAGELDAAFASALSADEIARSYFKNNAYGLSEREALSLVSRRATGLDVILSVAAQDPNPQRASAAFDAVIRSRAMVLDELAERRRIVAAIRDPEVSGLLESYRRSAERVAYLAVQGPGSHPEQHQTMLAEAQQEREQAERVLGEHSAVFRTRVKRAAGDLSNVAASLPPDSALVAYVRYNRGLVQEETSTPGKDARKRKPVPSYAAFVLRSGAAPEMIPLGSAAEIEARVTRWGSEAAQGLGAPGWTAEEAELAYRAAGTRLRETIWDPVASRLKDASLVLLVPDASLHQVNVSALPAGEHEYLLETGPLVHYLSAERDLVGDQAPTSEGLLAMGAPEFDERSLFAAFATEEESSGSLLARNSSPDVFRGERSACGDFSELDFDPLPASKLEVGEIASLWSNRGKSDEEIEVLTGAQATETAFKKRAPGKRIVHLATHGFFMDGICPSASAVTDRSRNNPDGPLRGDNPLLLSGLALAGANHRRVAAENEDDGILTAEEVAALDLTGVEWAVLSACETGLGRPRAGEGVFGLRRAFQIAGARTMVVSLWRVQDATVRQWMNALYRARFTEGRGTAESVREASLAILQERRKRGLDTHPFHWAAFVASGDWR